jgi:hypothetical protein
MMIARRLQLDDGYDYKFERWIKLLKDNWIQNVGTLIRVPPSQLAALNLPIALKLELDEICNLGNKLPVQSAHFYLQEVCFLICAPFNTLGGETRNKGNAKSTTAFGARKKFGAFFFSTIIAV